jgi:hypothetical protein
LFGVCFFFAVRYIKNARQRFWRTANTGFPVVRDPRSNRATAGAHVGAKLRPRTMARMEQSTFTEPESTCVPAYPHALRESSYNTYSGESSMLFTFFHLFSLFRSTIHSVTENFFVFGWQD